MIDVDDLTGLESALLSAKLRIRTQGEHIKGLQRRLDSVRAVSQLAKELELARGQLRWLIHAIEESPNDLPRALTKAKRVLADHYEG